MTALFRAIRSSALLRAILARLGAAYIMLIHRTVRWEKIGAGVEAHVRASPHSWILAIWHGRLLQIPPLIDPSLEVHAMISANHDGDIISACVNRFGIEVLRGSSADRRKPEKDKMGRAALEAGLEKLRSGRKVLVALTPDGPRGPRMRCQPGVALLSARSGAPVMPWAYATRRAKPLGSWDKFLLPLPFDRGVMVFGDPIPAPRGEDAQGLEAHRMRIEEAMLDCARRADLAVGRAPVEPKMRPAVPGGEMAPWPPREGAGTPAPGDAPWTPDPAPAPAPTAS